jgi:hypothetical protein
VQFWNLASELEKRYKEGKLDIGADDTSPGKPLTVACVEVKQQINQHIWDTTEKYAFTKLHQK